MTERRSLAFDADFVDAVVVDDDDTSLPILFRNDMSVQLILNIISVVPGRNRRSEGER